MNQTNQTDLTKPTRDRHSKDGCGIRGRAPCPLPRLETLPTQKAGLDGVSMLAREGSELRFSNAGQVAILSTSHKPMLDDLVEQHLGLARMIAYEYANIPGASMDEVIAEAENALAAAGRAFDPRKGQFTAYAGRAIRNALNSLFTRQLRYVKVHDFSLDAEPATSESTASPARKDHADPGADVPLAARAAESRRILDDVLGELPPRSRSIVVQLREGKSYGDIGAELGISKQAVHKVGHAALQSLREKLEARGFSGIDSKGFLKSARRDKAAG